MSHAKPSESNDESDAEDIAVSDFLDRLLDDIECGKVQTLEQYQRLFRGHDSRIAAEYARALGGGATLPASSGPNSLSKPIDSKSIGPYEVEKRIGSGGMGAVYLAWQSKPLRRVAVKVIQLGLRTRAVLGRFEAEQQAIARMDHENIAKVYDAGVAESGVPYFAMEYIEGKPLLEYCDRRGLTIRKRLRLFLDICAGVQHAHQKAIIHRDLKPSNILIVDRHGRPTPKIIDFGLAKSLEEPLTEQTVLTAGTGRVIGTPHYMSPEQASGSRDIDTRTDVYSLGAVLYRLLVGYFVFDTKPGPENDVARLLETTRKAPPKRPSDRIRPGDASALRVAQARSMTPLALRRALRGDLDRIVLMCLRKEPDRRYASANELARDIRAFLENRPVDATRPSPIYIAKKFLARNRLGITVTCVALAGLTTGFALIMAERDRTQRALAEYEQMADVRRLEDLLEEEPRLWPATPDTLRRMGRWLTEAEELRSRLGSHRRTRDRLRTAAGEIAGGEWVFARDEDRWKHEVLDGLVRGLGSLDGDGGWISTVRARQEAANQVRKATLDSYETEWKATTSAIRDRSQCPLYNGLELPRQLGLVPLGRDPRSGLFEFAVWHHTGKIPTRGEDGMLQLGSDFALVLVLIPGGTVTFADQREEVAPFFLSKYEMTQTQWQTLTGENPSFYRPDSYSSKWDRSPLADRHRDRHPVEQVSWNACAEVLRWLELEIPTEVQWLHAATAGTTTTWWTGNDRASLEEAANVADRWCKEAFGPPQWEYDEDLNDGFAVHAPVGWLPRANRFGLHDTAGNVWEWCRNSDGPGEGGLEENSSRNLHLKTRTQPMRGGCFSLPAIRAASASREDASTTLAVPEVGIRPARRIQH